MALLSVVTFFFYGWLAGRETLGESVRQAPEEYWSAFQALLTWRNGVEGAGHLWYVYTYGLLILCLPMLTPFVRYLDGNPKAERGFLVATFGLLALNDVTRNQLFEFGYHTIDSVVPAAILAVWGHILYKHRALFSDKKLIAPTALLIVAINLVRAFLVQGDLAAWGDNALQYWYTTFGVVSASCLIAFCYAVAAPLNEGRGSLAKVIARIGGLTFSVYLIHVLVIAGFQRIGIVGFLRELFLSGVPTFGQEILYTVSIIGLVFAGSLFLAYLLQQLSVLAKCASRHLLR